jgi:pilus assembly protein CpaF
MSSSDARAGADRLQHRINALAARRAAPPLPAASAPALSSSSALAGRSIGSGTALFEAAKRRVAGAIEARMASLGSAAKARGEIAGLIETTIAEVAPDLAQTLDLQQQRDLVTHFVNQRMAAQASAAPAPSLTPGAPVLAPPKSPPPVGFDLEKAPTAAPQPPSKIEETAPKIYPLVLERIDSEVATRLNRAELATQLSSVVAEVLAEQKISLNQREQRDLVTLMLNDMLGLGPLDPLLADESVTDIMVNGPKQIYVERKGKLVLTGATFRDNAHVMAIATRIVSTIGRRVDESSPLCDARLMDGSRVNIIIPPLAIDGPSISIRKFSKRSIDLDRMAAQQNISPAMATVLKIASRVRLNILISGGTGSGKTTLLNALSQMIDVDERVVTIEDAAELQMQQPHVVRLETRPANLEGKGEISMRDLVKNALRMRPDRIILGEIRGAEAIDMLQAMNTGHDGSLGTIHANRPREALTRLENMVGMSGINLPARAVRTQIAAAVHMILQVSRMRDGVRRVTSITEVIGMEGEVITTQELFSYKFEGQGLDGMLRGQFESSGLRPNFMARAEYYGLDRLLMEAMG